MEVVKLTPAQQKKVDAEEAAQKNGPEELFAHDSLLSAHSAAKFLTSAEGDYGDVVLYTPSPDIVAGAVLLGKRVIVFCTILYALCPCFVRSSRR